MIISVTSTGQPPGRPVLALLPMATCKVPVATLPTVPLTSTEGGGGGGIG